MRLSALSAVTFNLLAIIPSAHAGEIYQYECRSLESRPARNVLVLTKESELDSGFADISVATQKDESSPWKTIKNSVHARVKLRWSKHAIVAADIDMGRSGTIKIKNTSKYDREGQASAGMKLQIVGAKDPDVLDAECKWQVIEPKPSVSGSN